MPDRSSPKASPGVAINRREFLKTATLLGTGMIAPAVSSSPSAEQALPDRYKGHLSSREAEQVKPLLVTTTQASCGSDFMIDAVRNVGLEYVAAIPGNTFKGLHEFVIKYGLTSAPALELISCMHEEMSVAIAHGYAKVAGKPMRQAGCGHPNFIA